jgi:hypothetical protein
MQGIFTIAKSDFISHLLIISLAGTLIESFPIRDVDNISVTAVTAFLGWIMF